MKLGIFGGTFDPPHLVHLILAEEAWHQLGLDRLLWVLTPSPPHKRGQIITPLPLRLDMLRAAIADNPAFELSTVDIDRPAPHYALDTVRLLGMSHPGAELIYLMGGDSLRDLPSWRQPLEFLTVCHTLGVVRRPSDSVNLTELEAQIPGLTAKVRFVDAPLLDIASSDIRRRVAEGRPARYFLPAGVYEIIQERGLYR
jgi:nicotinate-nucleotide adenylyltransferase